MSKLMIELTPEEVQRIITRHGGAVQSFPGGLAEAQMAFRRAFVIDALIRNNGVMAQTALDLGIGREGVYKLLRQLSIPRWVGRARHLLPSEGGAKIA